MPLSTEIVGESTHPLAHQVDARWLMAYAAGLRDFNPRYMDTQDNTVVAHPVFPVCLEWPVILNTREMAGSEALSAEESARGVHAAHDLHIYRPIRAGDNLLTHSTMIGVRPIKPGAAYTMRLDTIDADTSELVTRTYQLGIYRGVEVDGGASDIEQAPALPELDDLQAAESQAIEVLEGSAHTYTECARIWNPIHTDRAVALQAGLPDIILHGTATLALAVSKIVERYAAGDPSRVNRLGGRFAAMVMMPSTLTLQTIETNNLVSYQVLTGDGQTAISGGFVCLN
jgi:acyl dehydratase